MIAIYTKDEGERKIPKKVFAKNDTIYLCENLDSLEVRLLIETYISTENDRKEVRNDRRNSKV